MANAIEIEAPVEKGRSRLSHLKRIAKLIKYFLINYALLIFNEFFLQILFGRFLFFIILFLIPQNVNIAY